MEYTKNYHLPQWDENDRIMMDDFNQMCGDIESGITAAQGKAEQAQNTADAAYCPDKKPYVIGSYRGANATMSVDLGFRPSFLIISGSTATTPSNIDYLGSYDLITDGTVLPSLVTFTDTGFTLHKAEDTVYPQLVRTRTYSYIAFR